MINDQNMYRKQQGTEKHHGISFSQGQFFCHTEEIKPADSQYHTEPDFFSGTFFQKDAENRNQHDIHGRNKTGFSHSRITDTELLEITCNTEAEAA